MIIINNNYLNEKYDYKAGLAYYELGFMYPWGTSKNWVDEDERGCYFSNEKVLRDTKLAKKLVAEKYEEFRIELLNVIGRSV